MEFFDILSGMIFWFRLSVKTPIYTILVTNWCLHFRAITIISFCSTHSDFEKLVSDISYLNKSFSINKLSAISTSGVNTNLKTGPLDKKGSWLASESSCFYHFSSCWLSCNMSLPPFHSTMLGVAVALEWVQKIILSCHQAKLPIFCVSEKND